MQCREPSRLRAYLLCSIAPLLPPSLSKSDPSASIAMVHRDFILLLLPLISYALISFSYNCVVQPTDQRPAGSLPLSVLGTWELLFLRGCPISSFPVSGHPTDNGHCRETPKPQVPGALPCSSVGSHPVRCQWVWSQSGLLAAVPYDSP